MKLIICAVYDAALQAYLRPFPAASIGVAVREFGTECRRPDSPLKNHAKDYSLYLIGEFDDQSGSIIPRPPEVIDQATNHSQEA